MSTKKIIDNEGILTTSSNVFGRPSPGLTTDRDGFLMSHIVKPLSIYDEILTYSRKSVIQYDFTYGIIEDLINIEENNSATIVWNMDGMINLNSNTDPAGASVITTTDFIKSQADEGIDVYITASFDTPTVNNIQEIGLGSATDGVFFCQDENGLYVFTRNNSVDTIYRRADWNVDKLDGLGKSGMILNPTNLNVYRIEFVNNCCFTFYVKNDKTPEWNPVHTIQVANEMNTLPLRLSNNFICVVSRNTGATTGARLKVSNFSVYNSGEFKVRGPLRSTVFTKTISAPVPVLSIKNIVTFKGIPNKITCFLQNLSVASDGTKNVIISLYKNATLTTPTWVDFDVNNSPIQYDTTSASFSSGRLISTQVLGKEDSAIVKLSDYSIKVSPNETITIVAESVSNSDVSASFLFRCNL